MTVASVLWLWLWLWLAALAFTTVACWASTVATSAERAPAARETVASSRPRSARVLGTG